MAKKYVAELFSPGSHGSTFGGNPLACRAGLATLEVIEAENLCENAAQLGSYMVESFREKLSTLKIVKEVRGKGFMIGIELAIACNPLVDICLEKNLLISVTSDNVIRLLPPLILEKSHADTIVGVVVNCVHEFSASQPDSTTFAP